MSFVLAGSYSGSDDVVLFEHDIEFIYDGEHCAFHDLLKIINEEKLLLSLEIPSKWKKAWDTLYTNNTPNWRKFVGENLFDQWIDSIKFYLEKSVKRIVQFSDYYTKCLVRCRNFLDNLKQTKINTDLYKNISFLSVPSVYSFEPDHNEFAKKPKYSLSSTKTGRLTIIGGPNILTLTKEYRKLLKSRFKNGKILYCDIGQFETRVAMSYFAKMPQFVDDIYSDVVKHCSINIDRDHAKKIVISLLFGMHTSSIKKDLNLSASDAVMIVDSIKKYLGLRKLEKWIKDNRVDWQDKKLYNAFGRPISITEKNTPFVNYYVQSTAVDLAVLSFKKIVSKFDKEKVIPLFVQHDALIIDVDESCVELVCSSMKSFTWNNAEFPINISVIT